MILLDTCAVLWLAHDQSKLTPHAKIATFFLSLHTAD